MSTGIIHRIEEEVPLIPLEEDEIAEPIPKNHDSARLSVVAMIGLLCIFIFLISTVLFASLYMKLLRGNNSKIPPWPKSSPSVLGEYSTAAVAADNEICSDIGRDILLHGGNAVDAAIATLFCIGVMDTQSAGLGGGHFMTIFNATTKTCHVVDAREIAPLAAFKDMYKDKWNNSKYGWEAIGVPGELHGLWTEYKNYGGKIEWKKIVQPTIDILAEGPPTSHHLAGSLKHFEKQILAEPTMRKYYINPKTKQVYKVGEQIRTRDNFKRTLQRLADAEDPVELFYKGEMMKEMVKEFQEHGGIITEEDFKSYKSIIRNDDDVIQTHLANGRHICGPPPPSGSAVAQAILNILDGYQLSNLTTFDDFTTLFHRFIEASKFSYGARSALGDMDFVKNSSDVARYITSAKWAEEIRKLLTDKSHPDAYYGGHFRVPADHGTTSISVIDKKGNAVAVTSTINLILGALVSSDATGILWDDEMDDFSIPGHPNYFGFPPTPANFIEPGKRPMSSMAPIVIFNDNNRELLAVGGAGGSTIISGVANVALHSLWLKNDIKEAVDFPRFHNQLQPNVTVVEHRMPERYVTALKEYGHTFRSADNYTTVTAVHRAIDGQIYANSDFRKGSESEPSGY
jgi:gamma-glutamyltranspeptidase/glutathione hydrolase/leukotriene-C4 hydrolase